MDQRETIALNGDLRNEEERQASRLILEKSWESGTENLKIDLGGVTALDFDSLTELLKTCSRFRQAGTKVELVNLPERVRGIFEMFRIPVSEDS